MADVSLLDDRFRAIFPDEELPFVRTVGEALRALDVGDYALAIIGMHFDDSKMFELLWNMKAKRLSTPVVCVQGLESALATASGVETAARALGACDFIDLREVPADRAELARLRERFFACMARERTAL